MSHESLWAPWRLSYIKGDATQPVTRPIAWLDGADHNCFLCRAAADTAPSADRENLVVARRAHSLVVINRYPYNSGHVLIAPLDHHGALDQLAPKVHAEISALQLQLVEVMTHSMQAAGFNIGLNLGQVAGAGVPGHLHWHVVPRWPGDVNFMPVIASTKVLSQSLDSLWQLLTPALKN